MYTANKSLPRADVSAAVPQQFVNKTGAAVGLLVVVILGISIGALTQLEIPDKNHDILLVLVTAVATNVTSIVSFFFGSSSSNKAKDDAISTLASTAADTQSKRAPDPGAGTQIPLAAGDAVTVKAEDPKP